MVELPQQNKGNLMQSFKSETAALSVEVEAIAASLLASGRALSHAHAVALAEADVQERRRLALPGDLLAKVLPADSGPLHG